MSDPEARRFRRNLTAVLSLVGLLTAGSVFLFGHLLFKTLSKDVVDEALLYSRQDAQRIARGLAERASGDLYTLKVNQEDLDVFVGSALAERRILSEVRVYDSRNQLVYAYSGVLSRPERAGTHPEAGQTISTSPLEPASRSTETTAQIADPYGIEVPIGDFGTLKVGVSQRELEARVEVLRVKLYKRIFAAALVSFLGILAAAWALMLLVRRTRLVEAARGAGRRRRPPPRPRDEALLRAGDPLEPQRRTALLRPSSRRHFFTARPWKRPASASSSSIRRRRLYFASRSERDAEPVLMNMEFVATARSAIVVSSVSPER